MTRTGTLTSQETVISTLADIAADASAAGMTPPAIIVVGPVVDLREALSWFETKPLFGWRVLVPRTKEQAGVLSSRLRGFGAVPEEVPTISVEPPRNPQQMDKAVRGLVEGRYEWIAFTSVNAVRAVREKFEEYGLDARAFSGLKIAAVGDKTASALADWGLNSDLVPSGEQSARGLLEDWPPYDDVLDPINRVFLPRADIATETLVAGLVDLGWEVDDVTAYRTVRAAPPHGDHPRGDQDRQVRRGRVHLVLDGAQPGRHRRQAAHLDDHRGDRSGHRQDRRGARPARRRAGARAVRRGRRGRARRLRCRPSLVAARVRPAGDPSVRASPGDAAQGPHRSRRLMPGFPDIRPRRLRRTPALRRLVAETAVRPDQLVLPMFVAEDATEPREISSMPGVVQHTRDSLKKAANEAVEAGLGGVMLFGLPAEKDAVGSGAIDPHGILNVAITDVVAEVGDQLTVMSDLCLDEFTDHGHCGVLDPDGEVDNDRTLEIYGQMALAHAAAGVDLVGPSGMMDGQVGVIRRALDAEEHFEVGILAYSAKYSSALLRPLPRGGELLARGRPQDLPAEPRQPARGRPRGAARRLRGRRHRDGQAGDVLPRRGAGGPRGGRRPRGGVQHLR